MKLNHDFHIHTVHSFDADANATVNGYVEVAEKTGITKLGFAEHFWDEKIEGAFPFYRQMSFEHTSITKKEIEECKNSDIKLYFGCEVEYNPSLKAPAITEETAQKFDYIIVPNSHSHETMPKEYYDNKKRHLDFIMDAYNNIVNCSLNRYITAIAHPFSLVRCPYPCDDLIDMVSDDEFKKMFFNTAEKEIAIEINASSVNESIMKSGCIDESSSLLRMFRLAKDAGCRFIFGSDAHYLSYFGDLNYVELINRVAENLEIKEKDIVDIAR